jgi:hypothetical protein
MPVGRLAAPAAVSCAATVTVNCFVTERSGMNPSVSPTLIENV